MIKQHKTGLWRQKLHVASQDGNVLKALTVRDQVVKMTPHPCFMESI